MRGCITRGGRTRLSRSRGLGKAVPETFLLSQGLPFLVSRVKFVCKNRPAHDVPGGVVRQPAALTRPEKAMTVGHGGLLIYRPTSHPRSFPTPPTISVLQGADCNLQTPRKEPAENIIEPRSSCRIRPLEGPFDLHSGIAGLLDIPCIEKHWERMIRDARASEVVHRWAPYSAQRFCSNCGSDCGIRSVTSGCNAVFLSRYSSASSLMRTSYKYTTCRQHPPALTLTLVKPCRGLHMVPLSPPRLPPHRPV